MKTLIRALFLMFIVAISSCKKTDTLKIEFDDVTGLEKKSPVLINGFKVGSVTDIKLQPTSKILVEAELNDNTIITQDAAFIITALDMLGTKGITIDNGNSTTMADLQKIHQGQRQKGLTEDSTIVSSLKKVAEKFSATSKLDSIENQLKKLNNNIEQLNRDKQR